MSSHLSAPPKPHDEEPSADQPQLSPLEAFLDANFRKIAYGCLGLIAVTAIVGIVRYRSNQAALQAAIEATKATTVDDCAIVAQKYKGSVAAGNALLTKAKLQWQDNKKDTAIATLREFVAGYTDHPFYLPGLLSLATRLESLGGNEAKEAQSIYEKIVKEHKDSEIAGLAQMRLGDLQWAAGKEDEAKKVYEELPRKFPGQFFDENTKRLDWIASALPTTEVDAPKVPDAIKAPAAGDNKAPAINLNSKSGVPGLGTSAPFEVKLDPPKPGDAKPAPGAANPAPKAAPKLKIEPAPANGAKADPKAAKPLQLNGGTLKVEPSKPQAVPNAPQLKIEPAPAAKPAAAPPAPAPAPAPAKADGDAKK